MANDKGVPGGGVAEDPRIIWNQNQQRFETQDKKAYLQYELKNHGNSDIMGIIHTYVPPSKRGFGLASHLCVAAFNHARSRSLLVIPSCSYVSDTFLPRNPSWNSLAYKGDAKSSL